MLTIEALTNLALRQLRHIHRLTLTFFIGKRIVDAAAFNMTVARKDTHNGFHRNGLARSRLTNNRNRLTLVQIHAHTADRIHLTARRIKRDVEVPDTQDTVFLFSFLTHIRPP